MSSRATPRHIIHRNVDILGFQCERIGPPESMMFSERMIYSDSERGYVKRSSVEGQAAAAAELKLEREQAAARRRRDERLRRERELHQRAPPEGAPLIERLRKENRNLIRAINKDYSFLPEFCDKKIAEVMELDSKRLAQLERGVEGDNDDDDGYSDDDFDDDEYDDEDFDDDDDDDEEDEDKGVQSEGEDTASSGVEGAQDGNGDVGGRSEEELQREKIAQQHMVEARDEIYRRNVAHQEVLLRELGQAKQVKASKDALAGKREDELTKNEINYVQTCNEKLTKNRRANYIAFYKVCNEKLDQVEKEEEEYLAELRAARARGGRAAVRRKWRLRGRCWGFGEEEVNTDDEKEEEGVAGEKRRATRAGATRRRHSRTPAAVAAAAPPPVTG